ncbi:MAG: GNAT family N-acetyltransferase [Nitrosopumilales archaeon CG11_big_fil_rev_8_21_14_0_20_33_24]|nr:MAG: GNAT family N-acetyltransferase [Nitrosopumilales archaeon CG11_big_fil_rev_8_21_14_0_20_33_24]
MSITKATEKDMPSILELLYELDRPTPIDDKEIKAFQNKIKDYFSDSQKIILLAKQDSKSIGLVSVILLRRLNREKLEMYIPELIVTKELRNSGIGKKLIQHCITFAKKKGCYRIRLESGNQRKESHQFYKNLGFEQSALSFAMNIM